MSVIGRCLSHSHSPCKDPRLCGVLGTVQEGSVEPFASSNKPNRPRLKQDGTNKAPPAVSRHAGVGYFLSFGFS